MEKKVLHISQSILAGVEAYFREIITYSEGIYQQVLVTPKSEQLAKFCSDKNAMHYVVNMQRSVNIFKDINAIFHLCRILRKEKPDIVHLHSAKAGVLGRLACRICNCKSVYTPNAVSYLSFTGFKRVLFTFIEVFLKRFTDTLLAVSYSEAVRLIYEIGHDKASVQVVLNSITMPAQTYFVGYNSPKKVIKIGTMARLTQQKNPLLFIDIANDLLKINPDIEFYILGGGHHDHLGKEVEHKINAYNIKNKVHILNWANIHSTEVFLKGLDLFLLTSIFEGLPFALLEAMSIGLPCVVSKCDGCNDVIQHSINGFSCNTTEEFTYCITQVLLNVEMYNKISVNAQQYVRQYHNSIYNIPQIHSVYETTITK